MGSPENAEQLIIALEPEAAAIFCQERTMSDFQTETGSRPVGGLLSQPNTHYIVVDIGGKLSYYRTSHSTEIIATAAVAKRKNDNKKQNLFCYFIILCHYWINYDIRKRENGYHPRVLTLL